MGRFKGTFVLLAAIYAGFLSSVATAETTTPTAEQFNRLADFATKICGNVPLYSERASGRIGADGKAEFARLLKGLLNLGVHGKVDAQFAYFEGVAPKDLPLARISDQTCKVTLINDLKFVVFPQASFQVPSLLSSLDGDYQPFMPPDHSGCDGTPAGKPSENIAQISPAHVNRLFAQNECRQTSFINLLSSTQATGFQERLEITSQGPTIIIRWQDGEIWQKLFKPS